MQTNLTRLDTPYLIQSINSGIMHVAYYTGYTDDDPELKYAGNHMLYYNGDKKSVGLVYNFKQLGIFKDVTPSEKEFPKYLLLNDA